MGDIESMFYQVIVPEDQRGFVRFLWWPDGDLSKELVEYQMNVHIFGAVSSPSCSNFALRRAADDVQQEIGIETANVLKRNFYVDDCLRSDRAESIAIKRVHGVKRACAHGGFKLTKITSNSRKVLESIPINERSKEVRTLDLSHDSLPIERALGVHWNIKFDTIGFRITIKDRPLTRRGILSTITSIYDPLGIAAPALLPGKKILQDLCREKVDWDDMIPDDHRFLWIQWKESLSMLENLEIPRCFKPETFGNIVSREIHSFSDASCIGYGQVSYLRQENDQGDIHCAFLFGKARLAPIKPVTIPRLELTAAVLSARVTDMLIKELEVLPNARFFWTDSTTVLKYLQNETARYKIFVANRIQTIRESTELNEWHYVNSSSNPADDASRGVKMSTFIKKPTWINAPKFLWNSPDEWPKAPSDVDVNLSEDPEVVVLTTNTNTITKQRDMNSRFNRFSNWHLLTKVVAWLLRLKFKWIRKRSKAEPNRKGKTPLAAIRPITVEELKRAEEEILKIVQMNAFPDEIRSLKSITKSTVTNERDIGRQKKKEIKKSSSLYRLDPFICSNDLLRVGGRLRRCDEITSDCKYPIILPRKGHVTELIIRHSHESTAHGGRGLTINEIRNRYWIINVNSTVRNFISKCVTCRKLRGGRGEQKMADLPKERLVPSAPFTYCGVDLFGPCIIKDGRKELKRYGVLLTCMSTRAIHLESANSLETDSFLNSLRRFIARRGPVRQIRSDQATNLMGAKRELKEAFESMNHKRIQEYLCRHSKADWMIDWKPNPPAASHMGGIWERQIKFVQCAVF